MDMQWMRVMTLYIHVLYVYYGAAVCKQTDKKQVRAGERRELHVHVYSVPIATMHISILSTLIGYMHDYLRAAF